MYAAHFFAHYQTIGVVQAHTAKFFRLGHTQQAEIPHLLEDVMNRKTPGVLPFTNMGVQFLLHKIADGTAKFFVFLSENHGLVPVVFVALIVFWIVFGYLSRRR